MKVTFLISREFKNFNYLTQFLTGLSKKIKRVICSASGRADQVIRNWCCEKHITVETYPLLQKDDTKETVFKRNRKILDETDLIVLIWDGNSEGIEMYVDWCIKSKKKKIVIFFDSVTQKILSKLR